MITHSLLQWTLIIFAGSLFLSQTLMDASAILMILTLFWMGFRWKEQLSHKKIFSSIGWGDFLFIAWFVWTVIGLAATGFERAEWYLELLNFKWILVFFGLVTAVKYLEPDEKIIFPSVIFLALISIYSIVIWFMGFDPITSNALPLTEWGTKVSGGFLTHPNLQALVLSAVLSLSCGMFFTNYKWKEKSLWVILAAVILMAFSLLVTMQADIWVTTVVAIAMMAMVLSVRFGLLYLFAKLLGLYLTGLIWTDFHQAILNAIQNQFEAVTSVFHQNFDLVQDHLLLGLGLGYQTQYLGQYDYLLVCTGILGLLIFISIQSYFLIMSFQVWFRVSSRNVFHQGLALGLLGAQFSILLSNIFHRNFENPMMINLIIMVWALVVWLAYEYRVIRERI